MADVVALDLEARVVVGAGLQDVGDVLEAVLEDALVAAREVGLFPVVLELLVAAEHLVQAEVHRAHVERRHLGLQAQRRLQPLLDAHGRRAAGGQVEDRKSTRLNSSHSQISYAVFCLKKKKNKSPHESHV